MILTECSRGNVEQFWRLDAAELVKHAETMLECWDNSASGVRRGAVNTLAKLSAAELAKHAATQLELLHGPDNDVRKVTLVSLWRADAAEVAKHATTLLERLDYSDEAAVYTLGNLNLAKRVAALLKCLDGSDWNARKAAVDSLAKLDAAELAKHAADLLECLYD